MKLNLDLLMDVDKRKYNKKDKEIFRKKGERKMSKSFEEQMKQLEDIVTELEKGELSLEESVSKFEEGIKLSKQCNQTLEEAEKKITILVNQDGEIKEEDFNTEG